MSERTLRSLIADGTVPHRRVGGRVFLAWPDDFDEFLAAASAAPAA